MQGLNDHRDKVIGIVGGMGPEAGIALFNAILAHTRAATDQDHLSVLLMSFPRHLTDRTAFIEGRTLINPAYNVVEVVTRLEQAGAEVIGLACNTIHAPEMFGIIVQQLAQMSSCVQLLNMPDETCLYLARHYPGLRRVGVMATMGTYKTRLYETALLRFGFDVIQPDVQFQHTIQKMIYDPEFGLKANPGRATPDALALMDAAIDYFEQKKAEAIVLGCTELPLILAYGKKQYNLPLISSVEALALALIREATAATSNSPTNGVPAAACKNNR